MLQHKCLMSEDKCFRARTSVFLILWTSVFRVRSCVLGLVQVFFSLRTSILGLGQVF